MRNFLGSILGKTSDKLVNYRVVWKFASYKVIGVSVSNDHEGDPWE